MALIPPEYLGYPQYRPAVEILEPEMGKCPVCGDMGSNCCGDGSLDHMIEFLPERKPDPLATFIVPERVFLEQKIGSRIVRKLVYSVGDRITMEEAQRLGFV